MMKVAVIGVGSISDCHLDSYVKNPETELYAICDINPKTLKAQGDRYNIPEERRFLDYKELLKLEEIEAVSVCTWNSEHAPVTIAALNAGKHVMCEKPMATNVEDAKAMLEAAKASGKHLQIGFVRRFGNDTEVLKDLYNSDFFGELYYAKVSYLRRNGNPEGWFGDKSRSGGGPLIDLGVHVIDMVRYLAGNKKPVSVYGATFQKLLNRPNLKTPKGYYSASRSENDICNVEDLATAMIRFEDGFVMSVEASFSLNIKNGSGAIELFGTKGGAKLDGATLDLTTEALNYMTNVTLAECKTAMGGDAYQKEVDHFVECIKDRSLVCEAPAEDGVTLMKILCAIYESAETGHEVTID
jgi:predicted dehydrogenase